MFHVKHSEACCGIARTCTHGDHTQPGRGDYPYPPYLMSQEEGSGWRRGAAARHWRSRGCRPLRQVHDQLCAHPRSRLPGGLREKADQGVPIGKPRLRHPSTEGPEQSRARRMTASRGGWDMGRPVILVPVVPRGTSQPSPYPSSARRARCAGEGDFGPVTTGRDPPGAGECVCVSARVSRETSHPRAHPDETTEPPSHPTPTHRRVCTAVRRLPRVHVTFATVHGAYPSGAFAGASTSHPLMRQRVSNETKWPGFPSTPRNGNEIDWHG